MFSKEWRLTFNIEMSTLKCTSIMLWWYLIDTAPKSIKHHPIKELKEEDGEYFSVKLIFNTTLYVASSVSLHNSSYKLPSSKGKNKLQNNLWNVFSIDEVYSSIGKPKLLQRIYIPEYRPSTMVHCVILWAYTILDF